MDVFSKKWSYHSGKLWSSIGKLCLVLVNSSSLLNWGSLHFALIDYFIFPIGIESFLMYSVHEGIRGIPLDPNDKMDALMPISGTSFAVGIDFHAGKYYVWFIVCMVNIVHYSYK